MPGRVKQLGEMLVGSTLLPHGGMLSGGVMKFLQAPVSSGAAEMKFFRNDFRFQRFEAAKRRECCDWHASKQAETKNTSQR